jgi:hypothetical protein
VNAIILLPTSETLLANTPISSLAVGADKIAGWMSEAQRLALGANRRARIMAMSADRIADGVSTVR